MQDVADHRVEDLDEALGRWTSLRLNGDARKDEGSRHERGREGNDAYAVG